MAVASPSMRALNVAADLRALNSACTTGSSRCRCSTSSFVSSPSPSPASSSEAGVLVLRWLAPPEVAVASSLKKRLPTPRCSWPSLLSSPEVEEALIAVAPYCTNRVLG